MVRWHPVLRVGGDPSPTPHQDPPPGSSSAKDCGPLARRGLAPAGFFYRDRPSRLWQSGAARCAAGYGSVTLDALLPFLVLAALAWVWRANLQAREAAVAAARRACLARGMTLLDHTVAFRRCRLRRGPDGRRRVQRLYGFEFGFGGDERCRGWVTLLGSRVESLQLEVPEGGREHEIGGD